MDGWAHPGQDRRESSDGNVPYSKEEETRVRLSSIIDPETLLF